MSEVIVSTWTGESPVESGGSASAPVLPAVLAPPLPRCAMSVRGATAKDLPFIDALQRMHSHMVGWMPQKQLEGKIAAGQVLIAEEVARASRPCSSAKDMGETPMPLGYCIAQDQYMGRDDVGIVYQLNVLPLKQRNLIGASLVKATFERAAYGCKLFCCWCAQDIQANWFWESIGFIPLAFRTGSRGKQRTHIFWQRRVRENDVTTPYWFPSQTRAGSLREDRLVLPIPPGTHWRDAKPLVLPDAPVEPLKLPVKREKPPQEQISRSRRMAIARSQSKHLKGVPPGKAAVITSGGIRYIERGDYVPEPAPPKPKRQSAPRQKHDPKHVAAARELRDRYLEQFNSGLVLPNGKYAVGRALVAPSPEKAESLRLPTAA